LQKYIKLNLFYLGTSKKHLVFRAKKLNKDLVFNLMHKRVFTEQYEEIGHIKEIFGPVDLPFISIKLIPNKSFDPNSKIYIKLR
jgi:rRNA processing protein Gar1